MGAKLTQNLPIGTWAIEAACIALHKGANASPQTIILQEPETSCTCLLYPTAQVSTKALCLGSNTTGSNAVCTTNTHQYCRQQAGASAPCPRQCSDALTQQQSLSHSQCMHSPDATISRRGATRTNRASSTATHHRNPQPHQMITVCKITVHPRSHAQHTMRHSHTVQPQLCPGCTCPPIDCRFWTVCMPSQATQTATQHLHNTHGHNTSSRWSSTTLPQHTPAPAAKPAPKQGTGFADVTGDTVHNTHMTSSTGPTTNRKVHRLLHKPCQAGSQHIGSRCTHKHTQRV